MFFLSKKLEMNEIVPTIKKMRNSQGREKDRAFIDLLETFKPKIMSLYSKYMSVASNPDEQKELLESIQRIFWHQLMSKTIDFTKSDREIFNYIIKKLETNVNLPGSKEELGKSSPIKGIRNTQLRINKVLRMFHKEYKREPDFRNHQDLAILANMLNVPVEKVPGLLKSLGSIQYLYENVSNDSDDSNVSKLIDSLKSQEPLPDSVIQDKDLKHIFEQTLLRVLKPDERTVVKLYFLENQGDQTKEEIAKKIKMDLTRFRHLLAGGLDKIRKNPGILKDLYFATQRDRMVKLALDMYKIVKIGTKYNLVQISMNEKIVSSILKETT